MALNWTAGLKKIVDDKPPIFLLYGGEGLGKTSFAADWPSPFYVQVGDNERPPEGVQLDGFGVTETFDEFMDQCDWMLEADHDRLTFVIDTVDSLESLVIAEACRRNGWKSLSDGQFAEPKNATNEVWSEVRRKLTLIKASGFAVVMIAHVAAKTDPGVTTESYPRYRPNIRQKEDADRLAHMADFIGFIYQRVSIQKEAAGFHKDNVNKRGEGSGERMIGIEERPGYIAKNRHKLSAPMKYVAGGGYEMFRPYIVEPTGRGEVDNVPDSKQEAA